MTRIVFYFLAGLLSFVCAQESLAGTGSLALLQTFISQTGGQCEPPPPSLDGFVTTSKASLIVGFLLVFAGIFIDRKKVKLTCWGLAVIPFGVWGYLNFLVDYSEIRKKIFNLDVRAEQTLSNIAEAQDRYKSEQEVYIKDLSQVKSHLAGAHGLDECVEILDLNVGFDHWTASAKHVSSPNIVKWDSTSGSSLKKG
ncbi:MAG: hypothetical protein KC553_01060 [Nitrospina sp.]|nr:hypothetical protein [Nitrospina sp.]